MKKKEIEEFEEMRYDERVVKMFNAPTVADFKKLLKIHEGLAAYEKTMCEVDFGSNW